MGGSGVCTSQYSYTITSLYSPITLLTSKYISSDRDVLKYIEKKLSNDDARFDVVRYGPFDTISPARLEIIALRISRVRFTSRRYCMHALRTADVNAFLPNARSAHYPSTRGIVSPIVDRVRTTPRYHPSHRLASVRRSGFRFLRIFKRQRTVDVSEINGRFGTWGIGGNRTTGSPIRFGRNFYGSISVYFAPARANATLFRSKAPRNFKFVTLWRNPFTDYITSREQFFR